MTHLTMLANRLIGRPLFVTPQYAEIVQSVLAHRLQMQPILSSEEVTPQLRAAKSPMLTPDGIYVLPVVGGLMHRGDSLDAMCGAQSYTYLQNQLVAALAEPKVKGILLDVDSPGGEAVGCFEFADTIRDAAKQKPIWSIANGMACSAAYAVACSASKFFVTPSGEVGSIGVVLMHMDVSKALDKAGVAVTFVYAGKHKIDGNPYAPLPASVKADLQEEIDLRYSMFVDQVAARRPMSTKEIRKTEAACFTAERAVEIGLADEIASFDAVLTAFSRELKPGFARPSPIGAAMTQQTQAPASAQLFTATEMAEAQATARANARAEAEAAHAPALADAYARGRTDAAAIMQHEAARGRMSTAMQFAADVEFSVEKATKVLATIPAAEDTGAAFQSQLAKNDPKVPAGHTEAAPATASQQHNDLVRKHLHAMIGGKAQ